MSKIDDKEMRQWDGEHSINSESFTFFRQIFHIYQAVSLSCVAYFTKLHKKNKVGIMLLVTVSYVCEWNTERGIPFDVFLIINLAN